MAEYIVIHPRFDETTEHSHDFCDCIVDHLCTNSKSFVDLSQDDAVKSKVEQALKENPHAKVIFFNHGNTEALIGNNHKPVIDRENVHLLAHREYIITLACQWGANGGIEAWRQGCLAVLCYVDVVSFTTDALPEFEKAFTAAFFLREQGLDWKRIRTRLKDLMEKLSEDLAEAGKFMAAACMARDEDILRIYNAEPPTPICLLRRLAVKLLGRVGWKLTRTHGLLIAVFLIAYGVALHDYTHALWQVGGYREILSLQGGYIGFIIMLISFIGITWKTIKWLKKP